MFQYYNPHPKGLLTDDCVKRAIVVVTGRSYADVQRRLNRYRRTTGAKRYNSRENLHYALEALGAKPIPLPRKMSAEEFAQTFSHGRYILDMKGHWSACVDGDIYDTWDCSAEQVLRAYALSSEPFAPPNLREQVLRYCCTVERLSGAQTAVRIYDGNGYFSERKIPSALAEGYVLCLEHEGFRAIRLNKGELK